MPFFGIEKWITPFWKMHGDSHIFDIIVDIRFNGVLRIFKTSVFHMSLTATVKSYNGNIDSGTNQTCSLDSYWSTNAGFRCITTKNKCPRQIV